MSKLQVREETGALLNDSLLGDGDLDRKILRLLEGEFSRQLAQHQAVDQALAQKYAMSFADFMERRTTVQHSNSWEVEHDATEWEQAVRAISAVEERLQQIRHLTTSAG